MKPVTVSVLKKELGHHSQEELVEIVLQLAKFKKENKELLTYILYDSSDEEEYIRAIKEEIDLEFSMINHDSLYYVKKSSRKILRGIKKYIRYSKKKDTEAHLLLYFCGKLKELRPVYMQSQQMINMFDQQIKMAQKAIASLHEDLQYDFRSEIEDLEKI